MASILFVDSTHPKPYDFDDLQAQAMGGTESSLLRTARILRQHHHSVTVLQNAREQGCEQQGIQFIGPHQLSQLKAPEHVVILRKFPQLKTYHQRFPEARLHLWIHTYKNWEYAFKRLVSAAGSWQLITNSKTHAADSRKRLNGGILGRLINVFKPHTPVHACYNPIPRPPAMERPRDINKLLFLSAPNKGLDQVLRTFQRINRHLKDLRLFVANPGYRKDQPQDIPNVTYLGALPPDAVKQHIAESLCVFYPQNSFAETFGLIYAEANGLGTPVMAHDIGAAREILHPENALIDAEDVVQITKTLVAWQRQLPAVGYRDVFDDHAVYAMWQQALELND